jgi:hypothetical protein
LLPPSFFLLLHTAGLSYDTNETALKDAFSQYGDVIAGMYCNVIVLLAAPTAPPAILFFLSNSHLPMLLS